MTVTRRRTVSHRSPRSPTRGAYDRRAVARRTIRVAALGPILIGVLGLTALTAVADPRGVFVAECGYSHSLRDDPIVHPGDPGASHRHDFFANTSTNASSTVRTMLAASTTCLLAKDTAGYWFPTGYFDGVRLVPTLAKVYYFGRPRDAVEAPPRGLQIVAGNAGAASPAGNPHVTWSCGAAGTRRSPIVDHPYDCRGLARRWHFVDSVVARVELPSCWDGTGLAPSDLAYVDSGGCPTGFEHRLPGLHMQVHFGILDPCRPHQRCSANGNGRHVVLSLSSGPFYTFHADLWNTWHEHALKRLVRRCLDHHIRCQNV
jgi:hypothetical protein